jgi:hypothetical protein
VCDPIDMENESWGKTTGGGKIGPFNSVGAFTCSAREHARFCYLSMHRRMWAGRQIVPASYYDWAWQGTRANPAYGAQWWLAGRHPGAPRDMIQTLRNKHNSGWPGPSLDLVVARIGNGPDFSLMWERDPYKRVLAAVENCVAGISRRRICYGSTPAWDLVSAPVPWASWLHVHGGFGL